VCILARVFHADARTSENRSGRDFDTPVLDPNAVTGQILSIVCGPYTERLRQGPRATGAGPGLGSSVLHHIEAFDWNNCADQDSMWYIGIEDHHIE